ncbi:chemotaxis protein MotB [Andreprevotia lacus DSM 23236]|jgi:chemotaxis protein MotB|uniref:Chemotaxis protein MotB n=1 Tax=Andreprevotia lacus DSM 23236 TaxID=1121001 RepID=A0A1W1XLT7_9NEIS|nr:flagellar motor protein MotB [Andreprevotia lacus]SMC24787.1 chemotaxis protein MotB [Andreprevotia lacus DSM 23236]
MSDDSQRPIVVKKIKKGGHGHHGGAWKIAYADFVTAMMAFFLLMWLLGSVSKGNLKGISDYFSNPLKVANSGGEGAGDATSLIKGGGNDITKQAGQVNKGSPAAEEAARDKRRLSDLKKKFEALMDDKAQTNSKLSQYKSQLKLDMVAEGLRIQIVDEQNRPMFKSGSSDLEPYARDILNEIGKLLNDVPNDLSVSGHTDATPFGGGQNGYSNWELSSDRANAARRQMIAGGGMDGKKVLRVNGFSDEVPIDKGNIYNPVNRRISIVVLNKDAEQDIRDQVGSPPPDTAASAPAAKS